VRGIVLAAGVGNRLRPYTDHVPKALVPLGGDLTPFQLTLANFAEVGITSTVVVVGYKAEVFTERRGEFERTYGVEIELVHNDKALVWNNAYSLLCALPALAGHDALLANGDTVHPASFQSALLGTDCQELTICVDSRPGMAKEEMKVVVADGSVRRINKALDPSTSFGEYVGVALLPSRTHDELSLCLEAVVARDTNLYYEDGFQEYIDRGNLVRTKPTLGAPWTEIDDEADLRRARSIVCRS
jgi:choline kinase